MTCTMCKHEWCWICSEPNHGTKCSKPVQKDKRERFVAASKNALALEDVTKSSLEALADTPTRASVMALEGVVDNCITARSHIITIFADAQVSQAPPPFASTISTVLFCRLPLAE